VLNHSKEKHDGTANIRIYAAKAIFLIALMAMTIILLKVGQRQTVRASRGSHVARRRSWVANAWLVNF